MEITEEKLTLLSKALDAIHSSDSEMDEHTNLVHRDELAKICSVYSSKDFYHVAAHTMSQAAHQIGMVQTACILLNTGFMYGVRTALAMQEAKELETILAPAPSDQMVVAEQIEQFPQIAVIRNPEDVKRFLSELGWNDPTDDGEEDDG